MADTKDKRSTSSFVKVSQLSIYDAPCVRVESPAPSEPSKLDVGIRRTREVIWKLSDRVGSGYTRGSNVLTTVQSSPDLQHKLGIIGLAGAAGVLFAGARAGRLQRTLYGVTFSGCATVALWPQETKTVTRNAVCRTRKFFSESQSGDNSPPKVDIATPITANTQSSATAAVTVTTTSDDTSRAAEEAVESSAPENVSSESVAAERTAELEMSEISESTVEVPESSTYKNMDVDHGQSNAEDNDMYANRSL